MSTMSNEHIGSADQAEPEAPTPEIIISEIDKLRASNISLRLINSINREALAQHGVKDAQQIVLEAAAEREKISQEAKEVRLELAAKYGIDFSTHQINDQDGKVILRQRA